MQPIIVMAEDGFYKLTPQFLGPKMRELGEYVQRAPASIPNVSSITVFGMQIGINLVAQNNNTLAYSRLPYIRFMSEFVNHIDANPARSYSYPRIPGRGDTPRGPVRDAFWLVPSPFVLIAVSNSSNRDMCLALVNSQTSRIFRLPLPNLYDDGRVCLGDRPRSENVIERHTNNINAFYSNSWNTDLFSGREAPFSKLFQWSLTEDQQIASDTSDNIILIADREGVAIDATPSNDIIVNTVERYCVPLGNPMFDFVEHFI